MSYWSDIHAGLGILLFTAMMLGGWALLWWVGTRHLRVDRAADPGGWDERAQRTHDVDLLRGGRLLHYSTCWCREPGSADAQVTHAENEKSPHPGGRGL